jgi:transposase
MSDWEAEPVHWRLIDSAQLTVVVLDNCSLHTSKQVQAKWPQWQEKRLYFFFLPKYCSEMNPIEPEWHQLKTHELAGRMFEDEYDANPCRDGWR